MRERAGAGYLDAERRESTWLFSDPAELPATVSHSEDGCNYLHPIEQKVSDCYSFRALEIQS